MGEAKRKREALRRLLLEKGSEWDFPPSDWEVALCSELESQIVLIVPRATAEQLSWARMKANECHGNARWYADNDPEKKARMITGWWVQEPNYVLHSIVERDGQLTCITPSPFETTELPFIPDPKISWRVEGEVYHAVRDGRDIGPGIRKFPAFTVAVNAIIRERLSSGANPFHAVEFSDEEMEKLKHEYATTL